VLLVVPLLNDGLLLVLLHHLLLQGGHSRIYILSVHLHLVGRAHLGLHQRNLVLHEHPLTLQVFRLAAVLLRHEKSWLILVLQLVLVPTQCRLVSKGAEKHGLLLLLLLS